jgi:hypothetical protein
MYSQEVYCNVISNKLLYWYFLWCWKKLRKTQRMHRLIQQYNHHHPIASRVFNSICKNRYYTTATATTTSSTQQQAKIDENEMIQANQQMKEKLQQFKKNTNSLETYRSIMKYKYYAVPLIKNQKEQWEPKVTMRDTNSHSLSYHMYSDSNIATEYELTLNEGKLEQLKPMYVTYMKGYDLFLQHVVYLIENVGLDAVKINPATSSSVEFESNQFPSLINYAKMSALEDALDTFSPNISEQDLQRLVSLLKKFDEFYVPFWNIGSGEEQVSVLFAPDVLKRKLLAVFTADDYCKEFIRQHTDEYKKQPQYANATYSAYKMDGTEFWSWISSNEENIDGLVFNCSQQKPVALSKAIAKIIAGQQESLNQ